MTATYTCPGGHKITSDTERPPVCEPCHLIGTHYNPRRGEVYEWTNITEHAEDCAAMQEAIDAAFDNQYFSGGW